MVRLLTVSSILLSGCALLSADCIVLEEISLVRLCSLEWNLEETKKFS